MAKGKKRRTAAGVVLLQGAAVSVIVYLAGILLLALLVVKGAVPERAAFPAVAVLCLLGTLSGGVVTARRTPWGPLSAALLNTALFAAVLLVVGLACWADGGAGAGSGSEPFVKIHKFVVWPLFFMEPTPLSAPLRRAGGGGQIWGAAVGLAPTSCPYPGDRGLPSPTCFKS